MAGAALNVELRMSVDAYSSRPGMQLLVVHVHPKNIGKTAVEIDEPFVVSVKRIDVPEKAVYIDHRAAPALLRGVNIVKKYGGYRMESGVEYDELELFEVPEGGLYVVNATMGADRDSEVGVDEIVRPGAPAKLAR
ncbi:MAG: hypothetical protein ACOC7Q_02645 [bacterium]